MSPTLHHMEDSTDLGPVGQILPKRPNWELVCASDWTEGHPVLYKSVLAPLDRGCTHCAPSGVAAVNTRKQQRIKARIISKINRLRRYLKSKKDKKQNITASWRGESRSRRNGYQGISRCDTPHGSRLRYSPTSRPVAPGWSHLSAP